MANGVFTKVEDVVVSVSDPLSWLKPYRPRKGSHSANAARRLARTRPSLSAMRIVRDFVACDHRLRLASRSHFAVAVGRRRARHIASAPKALAAARAEWTKLGSPVASQYCCCARAARSPDAAKANATTHCVVREIRAKADVDRAPVSPVHCRPRGGNAGGRHGVPSGPSFKAV